MNLYGYAGGDPVNFSDPFGLCPDPKDPKCKYPDDKPLEGPGLLDPVALLAGGIGGGFSASVGRQVATKAVFWSGEGAETAAAEWASANGGRTLEMTRAGKALASSTKGLDFLSARPQWLKASIKFAEEAAGDVHVFHSAKGVSLGSVWRQEYQALMSNSSVQNIIYHIVH